MSPFGIAERAASPRAEEPRSARKGQTVILLGPQGEQETVAPTLAEHGISGRIATVTAGWQEREDELQHLEAHLEGRAESLRLHARGEEVFSEHPELHQAHRKRQSTLRQLQRLYQVRLAHAMQSVVDIARRQRQNELTREQSLAALESVTLLDAEHLERVRTIHAEFDDRVESGKWKAVTRHRKEIAEALEGCDVLAVAGGHVAVLLNRMRLFDVCRLWKNRPVIGWSAGAMVLAERVVVYHDSPPQGPGFPEALENGLGLVRGVVLLPHAKTRLRLEDTERVARLARRFHPALCIAMDEGSRIVVGARKWSASPESRLLTSKGTVEPLEGK